MSETPYSNVPLAGLLTSPMANISLVAGTAGISAISFVASMIAIATGMMARRLGNRRYCAGLAGHWRWRMCAVCGCR